MYKTLTVLLSSNMIKEIVEPMFGTMLPTPLSNLKFTKVDLGDVPMAFSDVKSTMTATEGIKLDMNLDWKGKCDIELDGDMVPAVVSPLSQLNWTSFRKTDIVRALKA